MIGMCIPVNSPGRGLYVETKRKSFSDDDPAVTSHYLDSFVRLCDTGLVMHQHGCTFRLTGQGFDVARKLRDGKILE